MTSLKFLDFLLLLLLLHQVYSEEAELVFRAEGTVIEMGYCFGVDYIVVYRCAPEGDQLLGNSSADSTPITPPVDLQGRIHINKHMHLLGLQISHLTHKDSGIYRRECWQNQKLVSEHMQQLSVCNEEVESKEIVVKKEDGGAELLCNNTSIGLEGTSVRWYHEVYPLYKPTLFLDSSVSLVPLVAELQGVVQVRDNGALLLLDNSTLKNNQHFICLVNKGKNCISFQNIHLPDHSDSWYIFASKGDRLVLKCPSDGHNQQWETPLGRFNSNSGKMHISFLNKSEDFSMLIPSFSEELSGDYSCISSSLEVQYLLVLCPKKESQEKVAVEGGVVSLGCDVGKNASQRVQWHRREPSGNDELIQDPNDNTVSIPEALRGRLTLSEDGSTLTISQLDMKDGGVYWCVALGASEFLDTYDEYKDDYDEEDTGEDDFSDGQDWEDAERCIFKQETILILIKNFDRDVNSELVTSKAGNRNHETTDPTEASNVTAYAVGAGVVVLLVAGVIVTVIAIKRRTKASPKHREATSHFRAKAAKDTKVNVDSGCTESLTEHGD